MITDLGFVRKSTIHWQNKQVDTFRYASAISTFLDTISSANGVEKNSKPEQIVTCCVAADSKPEQIATCSTFWTPSTNRTLPASVGRSPSRDGM
jgi:hypothetical protein